MKIVAPSVIDMPSVVKAVSFCSEREPHEDTIVTTLQTQPIGSWERERRTYTLNL